MTPTEARRATRLLDDRRGAIVLMAVFMSAFLVGGLWYVMGVGDAAMHRQTMQTAADSTAYIGAVYHARGMNIISMVNLIMAAVLAIAAAAKVLKMIGLIVMQAAEAMCALSKQPVTTNPDGSIMDYSKWGWTCDTAKEAKAFWQKMDAIIIAVDIQAPDLLESLSESQKEVARTTPWVGSSFSANTATSYKPIVASGAAASISMWPNEKRYGLPVQEMQFQKVCARGGLFAGLIVASTLPATFDKLLGKMLGGMMSMIPKDLCMGQTPDHHQWDFFDEDDVCEDHHGDHQEHDHCKEDIHKEDKPVPKIDLTKYTDEDKKSPKEPYAPAENGNDYFQVYASVTAGDDPLVQRSDKGVEIAAWNKAKVGAYGSMNEQLAVAQAEFYYDQTPAAVAEDQCYEPPCGMTWPRYREEAMWNLRWRARLRRFRLPTGKAEVNIMASGVPNLGFEKYDTGALTDFNSFAGSGAADKLWSSTDIAALNPGAAGFIGGGTALIH